MATVMTSPGLSNPSLDHTDRGATSAHITGLHDDDTAQSDDDTPATPPFISLNGGRMRSFSLSGISVTDLEELMPDSPGGGGGEGGEGGEENARVEGRHRVFSIDVDPEIEIDDLDSNDISALAGGTFEIDFKVNRDRSMSFEFFAFQMDEVEAAEEEEAGLHVDLGNLPMGSPLPPHTPSAGRRERGDSIIYDPKSFGDGGIHELKVLDTISEAGNPRVPDESKRIVGGISLKNVIAEDRISKRDKMKLERVMKKNMQVIAHRAKPRSAVTASSHAAALAAQHAGNPLVRQPVPAVGYRPMQTTPKTTPKKTSSSKKSSYKTPQKKRNIVYQRETEVLVKTELSPALYITNTDGTSVCADSAVIILTAAANGSSSGAPGEQAPIAALHCLNREGRIGIYTPEQRKARVKKFHSKRKMRIWRKRIKYDCRKKLADSRPRIKGRFVKRCDIGSATPPKNPPPGMPIHGTNIIPNPTASQKEAEAKAAALLASQGKGGPPRDTSSLPPLAPPRQVTTDNLVGGPGAAGWEPFGDDDDHDQYNDNLQDLGLGVDIF
mmetsp:Transcript_9877/g.19695  ORF Transcript_9877/g.19695 Transcript_9877/m.19695 type:complete len:553 (+) Transcript_9877:277-1935(+)